jgi:hypothetical protein
MGDFDGFGGLVISLGTQKPKARTCIVFAGCAKPEYARSKLALHHERQLNYTQAHLQPPRSSAAT